MRTLFTFLALTSLTAAPMAAQAQSLEEALHSEMGLDLNILSVNLPVWMSQHLPAIMAPAGIGAGSGIGDDSGGFSIGVVSRIGVFNKFNEVGSGLHMIDLESSMPSLVPWPQFGLVLGGNLGDGIELGGDFQFIPPMDIAADNLKLKASLISAAVTFRWRINKADGLIPAVILGLGASYYRGDFEVGAGQEEPYSETENGETVTGTVSIEAAPSVNWSILQASPEIRLAWDIGGVFRPYVGFGAGMSWGTVGDRVSLRAQATIETVNGAPVTRDPVLYDEAAINFDTPPALWTLRPHVGFDLIIGIVAITAQVDFAIMGKDSISTDFGDAAQDYDLTDPDLLFNRSGRRSQTNSAVVGTIAARLQF